MEKITSLFIGFFFCGAQWLFAADAPRGNLIELHSCELYAGGCIVSSEATLGGRNMLQVWDVTGGSWQGENLGGLQAAVLSTSSGNLAEAETRADNSIVYLPETATKAQRAALLAWLKSSATLSEAKIETRVVPVSLRKTLAGVSFTAGKFASVETVPLQECLTMTCGESLWYDPRAATSQFTVAYNVSSQVNEPLLKFKWTDNHTKSVFAGRFGDAPLPKNKFIQFADNWCRPSGLLF